MEDAAAIEDAIANAKARVIKAIDSWLNRHTF
jgi:hypothetical protein